MENVFTDNKIDQQTIKKETSIDFKMVTFTLAGKDYGINIMKVKEISKAGKFTFVPNSAPYVRGVYNLRGDIISVIDLRIFFNQPVKQAGENDLESMIIVRLEDHVIGIIVDEIDKVVGISSEKVQPPHPLFGDINIKYISGIAENNNHLYVILDVDAIFGSKSKEEEKVEVSTIKSPEDISPVYSEPEQTFSIVEEKDNSEWELGFIKETLVTFKQFYSTAVNEQWIKKRYSIWFEDRYNNNLSIQLTDLDDAEAYLQPFYSPFTNTLWSEEYINTIQKFISTEPVGNFNIWNPGCGKGYETYSIVSMLKKIRPEQNLKVHGSDKDLISVASAPGLLFDKSTVPDFYDEFMIESGGGYQFLSSIKDLIMFEFRDLENLEIFSKLDMVIIRDVLSFLKEDLQSKVIKVITENMKENGILVLGQNEVLPDSSDWESLSDNGIMVYRKR